MTGAHLIAIAGGLGAVTGIIELVRRRQLREKYAVLWLVLAVGVGILGLWPGLLDTVAHALGIVDPPNLLYFAALLVLLLIVVHLSWEVSRLEGENRTLVEEVAMLRLEFNLSQMSSSRVQPPPTGASRGRHDRVESPGS